MNKLSIITAAVVSSAALLTFYLKGSQDATLNRPIFDGFDKKHLKKAYKSIFNDVLSGRLNIDDKTEAEMDALLIERYNQPVM